VIRYVFQSGQVAQFWVVFDFSRAARWKVSGLPLSVVSPLLSIWQIKDVAVTTGNHLE
jgi:hypothetical protein